MLSEEGSPGMARNLADCRGAERAAFFEAARWFTRLFAPIAKRPARDDAPRRRRTASPASARAAMNPFLEARHRGKSFRHRLRSGSNQKCVGLILGEADLVETPSANMREYRLAHGAHADPIAAIHLTLPVAATRDGSDRKGHFFLSSESDATPTLLSEACLL